MWRGSRGSVKPGYCILAVWCDGKPVALAGYRVQVNLIYGKFLYVDDLVTEASKRRDGLCAHLLDALALDAGRLGCERLVLDTTLDNVGAHRFLLPPGPARMFPALRAAGGCRMMTILQILASPRPHSFS